MHAAKVQFFARFAMIAWVMLTVSSLGATIRDDVPDSDYVALGNEAAFAAVGTFVNS